MKIGFLGTGLMGTPMALQLKKSGYDVIAWNRSVEKLAPLVEAGIRAETFPQAVLNSADCIVLMLTDAAAIQATLLSHPTVTALANRVVIQMGTISPQESKDLAQQIADAGGEYIEATVLGSIPEARSGNLIVIVGATQLQFDQWLPLLKCFGPAPTLIGPIGASTGVKIAINQLIGTLTTAFSMSLALVEKEGISVENFMAIVRQSALYAPTFDKKLSRMCDRNFENPNFPAKHLLKDMNLFVQAAEAQGLNAEAAKSVSQVVKKAIDLGLAEADYSAVFKAITPD